jgi:serine phosphatase RsbU (regulator of sigma subunit)
MPTSLPDKSAHSVERNPLILIVDDDAAALRLLSAALSSAPFEIATAASGEEALSAIEQRVPDLVVLDFEMPGLNGAEVCGRIRKTDKVEVRELPIVMLTAYSGETEEVSCLEAGANDFVSKPVSASVLEARILTQLRLRAYARQLEEWNTRREADLACARSIQQGLVPQEAPRIADWDIQARYTPLIEVGGDMYGWERLADDRWLIWMADAVGHGAAAALVTALTTHLFSKASEMAVSPSAVLALVNRDFTKLMSGSTFLTACCAILEDDGGVIFSSVGNPPLLVRRRDGTIEAFASEKAMLGINPDMIPGDNAVSLSEGDVLLLYTDGLYSHYVQKGQTASAQSVQDALGKKPLGEKMIDDLLSRIGVQSGGSPITDDLAVIALRRLS